MNKRSFLKAITGLLACLGFGVKAQESKPKYYDIVPGFTPMDGRPLTINGTMYIGRPSYMMLHLDGCGKPAFLLTEYPPPGAAAESRTVRKLNGDPVEPFSKCVCESCGKETRPRREAIRHRDGRKVES